MIIVTIGLLYLYTIHLESSFPFPLAPLTLLIHESFVSIFPSILFFLVPAFHSPSALPCSSSNLNICFLFHSICCIFWSLFTRSVSQGRPYLHICV